MIDEQIAYKERCRVFAESNDSSFEDKGKGNFLWQWYEENRNEISLQLLGDICKDKRVLSVGGRQWRERELMGSIDAAEKVVTDIIGQPEYGVIEMDACEMSYPDQSFDVVICRELIEHVPDDKKLLMEIRRVLVDDGYLLITTPNGYASLTDGIIHVRAYSPQYFLRILDTFGFKLVKKAGNIPYIFFAINRVKNDESGKVFMDFLNIGKSTKNYEDLFYISSQMFVLCSKGARGYIITE